jgi:hypothetical protein
MAPKEYLGAWGTLIHEKNLKSKISCQTPFKEPRNRFHGIDFTSLRSLAGRYDNPIPTRFLAPMIVLKFQQLEYFFHGIQQRLWYVF